MNGKCSCQDELLSQHGMSALCPECAAEWAAWSEAEAPQPPSGGCRCYEDTGFLCDACGEELAAWPAEAA